MFSYFERLRAQPLSVRRTAAYVAALIVGGILLSVWGIVHLVRFTQVFGEPVSEERTLNFEAPFE